MTGSNMQSKGTLLSNRDVELYELCKISATPLEPQLFRILIELLRLDVSPSALFDVLHSMASQVPNHSFVTRRNTQNRTTPASDKKKPPVAAKPKKIRVDNSNLISF